MTGPRRTLTHRLLAWYRRLLGALPATFRQDWADEMVGLLADLLRDQPTSRQVRIFGSALVDLAVAVPTEHRAVALAPRPIPVTTGGGPSVPHRAGRPRRSRRGFLKGAIAMTAAAMGSGTVAAGVAYLWPRTGAGFGSVVDVGSTEDVAASLAGDARTVPIPAARTYLVAYDPGDDPDGVYGDIAAGGVMALYQKCVHLGCRVPWCSQSSWFECPCHGSKYNRWGEYEDGPAPRGLDRFRVEVRNGRVLVDTRTVVTGPSRAVDTLGEEPSGPHCR